MKNNKLFIKVIAVISVIFYFAVGFNFSPYLRGPAEYPPDWRWPYLFVNTLNKLWLPILFIFLTLIFYYFTSRYKEAYIRRKEKKFLVLLVLLCFLFQLSVIFFSRAGINVLIHRIINRDLNGYFSASLTIDNIGNFLKNYNYNVLSLPQHAQGHPPGAILFFWIINKFSSLIPQLAEITNKLLPLHNDVQMIWINLTPYQRLGGIISGFLIPFIASLTLFPIYYIGKYLYGVRIGFYSSLLYIFVPSVTLFTPLNDVFFGIFPLFSFLALILGLKGQNFLLIFISGLIFSFGLFFSLSILPLLLIFLSYAVYFLINLKFQNFFKIGSIYIFGMILLPVFLYIFFRFNFIQVAYTLMTGLPESRSYTTWLFYNFYDFFIFSGVPIMITSIYVVFEIMRRIKMKNWREVDILAFSFFTMLFLLNLSGSVKGEVGRIWLPFIPFLVLIISSFLTKIKLTKSQLIIILLLQSAQILVMQEFWVPLW